MLGLVCLPWLSPTSFTSSNHGIITKFNQETCGNFGRIASADRLGDVPSDEFQALVGILRERRDLLKFLDTHARPKTYYSYYWPETILIAFYPNSSGRMYSTIRLTCSNAQ